MQPGDATPLLGWALLALAVIDWRHLLLPDAITLPLIPLGLLVAWTIEPGKLLPHMIGASAGFFFFAAVAWIYRRLRGRDGLGLGDAKLLAAVGPWLSWEALPSVVFLGAAGGLVVFFVRAKLDDSIARHDRLPFGSTLSAAIWLVWLYGTLPY